MSNSVKINLTEDDIQHLMDTLHDLVEGDNNHVFTWKYEDSNGEPIDVEISVGDDDDFDEEEEI